MCIYICMVIMNNKNVNIHTNPMNVQAGKFNPTYGAVSSNAFPHGCSDSSHLSSTCAVLIACN